MFPVEDLAGTRAFPALQTSGKVCVAVARVLLGHNFLSFTALDASRIFNKKRMHLLSASTSAVVGSAIDLANSRLANCNSIRSPDKYASFMTLERYDVASCGESLTVHELSLARSPGVFTLCCFFFFANLIFRSTTLRVMNQLRSQYALAPFQTVVQPTAHKSYSTRVKEIVLRPSFHALRD